MGNVSSDKTRFIATFNNQGDSANNSKIQTFQRSDAFNLDTSDLNLPVECSDDFWNAFYQENQLDEMKGRSSSESEYLTDEPENE